MNRDDSLQVDILLAAQDILSFKAGYDGELFRSDTKTQAAVLHKLTVIGEAVRQLSADFKDSHPAVPWAKVMGMRNRLVHEYARIDIDEVWRVVEREIPSLIQYVEAFVPSRDGE